MPTLPKGVGTPYVALFNGSGQPIIDPSKNLPLGMFITSFNYEYIEESKDSNDDDNANIVIETDNPNIIDIPDLEYLMPIQVQWGWLFDDGSSDSSPVRSLVVKDYKMSFTTEGVKLDLSLISASFLLKSMAPKPINTSKSLIDHYIELMKGNSVPVEVLDFSNTTKMATKLIIKKK